jgi:glycerophosphoryl diester phosphodiesterase
MLAHLPRPTIFAHRGSSAYAPENTLAAFKLAIQHDADAIEFDTKLTRDGQVVVIHDQTVDRTTGASGRVGDLSLDEIRKLDAGSHFDIAFRGEPIPTLRDVFATIGDRIFYNIELTNYASVNDALPEKVAELVRIYNLASKILFSSFNPIALIRVRRIAPEIPIALLAGSGRRGRLARSWLGTLIAYRALHIELGDASPVLIEKTHRRGYRINVYTVNSKDDMLTLFNMGVDGIFTDDPVLARQALATAT